MSSYVPITTAERKKMLETIGAKTFDDLLQGIPKELRQEKLNLPKGLSEIELRHLLRDLAGRNETSQTYLSFLGGGAYDHFIPAAVSHLINRSEFYTAYTPYQPEASQGTLQVLFEYQSMICELTGMDVSNASLY
ncbi:MAG: glycine dehydrogenase, partial [Candidatus Omnitrophica bacterium]|nr:glycine dehydrogenase [Candidatus Omnitrophota bacterium]